MKLIIVESPTKAKTIGNFLGKGYKVESSYGHVRDLPKSRIGIDTENDFAPHYIVPLKARKNVSLLKKAAADSDGVILATDEDREGEAIAWHLVQALGLENSKSETLNSKTERIVFHEITKPAIEDALKNPRGIDLNLVDAQQARRVLDRLVGYELSPFLWRKIRSGLSAGRVQSVALRLIVEREREIENFKKEEYWTIEAEFSLTRGKEVFIARLYAVDGEALEKLAIASGGESEKIIEDLKGAVYSVADISSKTISRMPAPPFTTATLQQEASRRLGFSAKQTMMFAQHLYENGLITYMRTDSVNLAESALKQAKEVIEKDFGKNYSLESPRRYVTKAKGAQEAHEAIRPTDLENRNASAENRAEKKLYELVRQRALASQMKPAVFEQTAVDINADGPPRKYVFRANGQVMKFDGFLKVYGRDIKEELLPELKKGERLEIYKLDRLQHFTEPPPRYTDATLIKVLEAEGIGRPSTYAPILSTIQERGYVEKIEKKYQPTEIGFLVSDLLVEHFPEVVDVGFTAHMEEELDDIAQGKMKWVPVVREFYGPFKKHLNEKEEEVKKHVEISQTPCPHCGKMMIVKFGRFGKFLACPDPQSKITLPLLEEAEKIKKLQESNRDEKCPTCGKNMEVKRGRFGYFLGCVDYPKCKGIKKILVKTGFKCPKCGIGDIVEKKRRGRGGVFYGCSRYPECNFIINKRPENDGELREFWGKKGNKN